MNIGIVTFYNVRNYGAMLQAYSLWHYLSSRGHQIKFLNYPWPNSIKPGFPRRLINRHFQFNREAVEQYYNHRMTEFAKTFPATDLVSSIDDMKWVSQRWDVAIVGSDQMWNPNWTPKERFPLVFLDFAAESTRRIAYAVSIGEKDWNRSDSDDVGKLLAKFAAISVREESGIYFVKKLSGMDACCMPDPTLLNDGSFYRKLILKDGDFGKQYIFKYFLTHADDSVNCSAVVDRCRLVLGISDTVSDRGLPHNLYDLIVCLLTGGRPQVSLSDWLSRLVNSRFVITNSFHGTVFAILFHRPFITLKVNGRLSGMNERIASLLQSVGLEGRMVDATDAEQISYVARQKINWDVIDKRIGDLRRNADQFFKEQGL